MYILFVTEPMDRVKPVQNQWKNILADTVLCLECFHPIGILLASSSSSSSSFSSSSSSSFNLRIGSYEQIPTNVNFKTGSSIYFWICQNLSNLWDYICLTPWIRILFEKLTVAQLFVRSFKLLLGLASTVILGSGPRGTHGYIFPSGRHITVFEKLPTIQNPSQMSLVHAPPLYLFNTGSLPSDLGLGIFADLCQSGFLPKIVYVFIVSPMCATRPAHTSILAWTF
jgi:hypothetical protein